MTTPTWRDYADHYGGALGAYLERGHLDAYTCSPDDHPRFRCAVCGSAVTLDPVDGTEYGYRREQYPRGKGPCPHRDEEAVGAGGHPSQRPLTGATAPDAD